MTEATTPQMSETRLELTRVFDAPRELVWACWTEPEHYSAWFGPEGYTTPVESVSIDLRPGGLFKSTMVGPDGKAHDESVGTIEEVVPNERLVFSEEGIEHPMMDSQRVVVTLTDAGEGRTEMHLDITMVCVERLAGMAEKGWGSSFDKLAAVLARG